MQTNMIEVLATIYIIIVIGLTIYITIKSILLNRRINMVEKSIQDAEYYAKAIERRINWQEYSRKNAERLESLAQCSEED